VAETTIQAIQRHADLATTRKHYVKKVVVPEASKKAMKRLETVFTKMQKKSHHSPSKMGTSKSATKRQSRRKTS
jgi:hypothetical protein